MLIQTNSSNVAISLQLFIYSIFRERYGVESSVYDSFLGYIRDRVYSRFYFLTRPMGNFISRRECTRASILPLRVRGQSGRKIERIQFLSWFADFITPLHTVSYIRSWTPRTFAAAPLGSVIRGSFSSGFQMRAGMLVASPNGSSNETEFESRLEQRRRT